MRMEMEEGEVLEKTFETGGRFGRSCLRRSLLSDESAARGTWVWVPTYIPSVVAAGVAVVAGRPGYLEVL